MIFSHLKTIKSFSSLYEIAFSIAYQRIKTKRPNLAKVRNGSCDQEEDDDDEQYKCENSEIIM
jgi:hypothetical protein